MSNQTCGGLGQKQDPNVNYCCLKPCPGCSECLTGEKFLEPAKLTNHMQKVSDIDTLSKRSVEPDKSPEVDVETLDVLCEHLKREHIAGADIAIIRQLAAERDEAREVGDRAKENLYKKLCSTCKQSVSETFWYSGYCPACDQDYGHRDKEMLKLKQRAEKAERLIEKFKTYNRRLWEVAMKEMNKGGADTP